MWLGLCSSADPHSTSQRPAQGACTPPRLQLCLHRLQPPHPPPYLRLCLQATQPPHPPPTCSWACTASS